MDKKFLALSVAALMAVQPLPAVMASGSAAGTGVVDDKGSGTEPLDSGSNEGAAQTLEDVKTAAEAAFEGFAATNGTTADDILDKVNESITLEGVTAAWSEEAPFTLTEATVEEAGSITGAIVLTKDTETAEVAVDLTIARLEGEPEDPAVLADAVAAVETLLESYEVDNTVDANTVKADLLSAIQAAAQEAVEGVSAAWAQTEAEPPADDVTVTLAGIGKAGLVKGNVVLTKEDASETVAIDLEIAAKKTQSLEDVKNFVETSLKSYQVDNQLEDADAVKAAVFAFVQEEASKAMDGVTAAWEKTEGDEPEDNVKIIMPTTEKEGSVKGYIVLSAEGTGDADAGQQESGQPVIVDVILTIDKIVVENQELLDAQETIAAAVKSLYLTNSSQEDKILQVLDEELGSSDIKLTWASTDKFQLTPATTTETGLVTGTIVLSLLGQTKEVKVEKEIPKRDKNQITAEEAQDKAEDVIASITTTVNTDSEDINKALSSSFVGTFIDFRWGTGPDKYEKIASTTSKMGQITGTVYVYEVNGDGDADQTSERPVKVSLFLPKKESSNSRPSSGGNNSSSGNGNSIIISGNNNGNNNSSNNSSNNNTGNTNVEAKKFADLSNYSWAEMQINALVEKGVINGVSDTEFAPANNIKRADFLVMAMRLAGITDTPSDNFDDVAAGSYYYNAVGMAKQLGITSGAGNNQFLPETNITRQDMFVLAYNLLKNQGIITQDADISVLDSYADAVDVADYAKVAVATLLENGFVNGDDTNRINPVNNATRAESAVFLYNVSEKMD